jgi:hypothetical protein
MFKCICAAGFGLVVIGHSVHDSFNLIGLLCIATTIGYVAGSVFDFIVVLLDQRKSEFLFNNGSHTITGAHAYDNERHQPSFLRQYASHNNDMSHMHMTDGGSFADYFGYQVNPEEYY